MFDTRLVVGDLITLCLHRRVELPNSQHRIDLRLQNDPIVWLYKKVVSATFDARGKRLLIGHRGQKDHWYETVRLSALIMRVASWPSITGITTSINTSRFPEDFSGFLAVTGLWTS